MVGLWLGVIAGLTLLAAPLGYRFGLLSLHMAVTEMPRWATYLGMAAIAVGLLGTLTAFRFHRVWGCLALLGAVLGVAVAASPALYRDALGGQPRINDITTDTEDPPLFVALAAAREAAHAPDPAAYGGPRIAALQKQAYPDIVPLTLAMPENQAFTLALNEARKSGWTIVASDPAQGRIEATDRTGWYGFIDDVVVRVRSVARGSRLDVRSHSRVGHGDRGKNAERVRAFLTAVRNAAKKG